MSAPNSMLLEVKTMDIPQVAPWMFSRLVTLKRYPHAEELLELFNLFFQSCVHLKHLFFIKEGIYRIKGICMNTNDYTLLNSVCDTLVDIIKVDKNSQPLNSSPVKLSSIPYLNISTVDSSIKFKWESIRLILDLLKFKNHSVYIKAFEFCVEYKKTREALRLSYDILRNKQHLMQLGYQPYFELQLAHLSALYKLDLSQQALGVASDITSTLLNSNDGFCGVSLKLFAKDLLQDQMQQQQDISSLVTDSYISNHVLFDLVCQFYTILANDSILGPYSNYKLFLLKQFKDKFSATTQDLKPLIFTIIKQLISTSHIDSRHRQSFWPFLGYSTSPSNVDMLYTLVNVHSDYLSPESTKLIHFYLHSPPHLLISNITSIIPISDCELFKSLKAHAIKAISGFYSSISYSKLLKWLLISDEFELDDLLIKSGYKIDKCTNLLYFNLPSIDLCDCYRELTLISSALKPRVAEPILNVADDSVLVNEFAELARNIDVFRQERNELSKKLFKEQEIKRNLELNQFTNERERKDDEFQKIKLEEIEQKNKENLEKEQKFNISKQLESNGIVVAQVVIDNKQVKGNKSLNSLPIDHVKLLKDYELNKLQQERNDNAAKFAKQVDYLERALRLENKSYINKNGIPSTSGRVNDLKLVLESRAVKKGKIQNILNAHEDAILEFKSRLQNTYIVENDEAKLKFDQEQTEAATDVLKELKLNISKAKQELEELRQKEIMRNSVEPSQVQIPEIDRADKDDHWRRQPAQPLQTKENNQKATLMDKYVPPVNSYSQSPGMASNKAIPPTVAASGKYVPPSAKTSSMGRSAPSAMGRFPPSNRSTSQAPRPSTGNHWKPGDKKDDKKDDDRWSTVRRGK
eukprot:NODE_286_length_11757_cov_0.187768.p1 type:complete len:864 gc:universal NODE_286_length_11757_cov_0.187768:192-2783(+)